ncbi:hypothetical protein LVJ94_06045 [Pendulispora rubella]|uniref:Uncharacterized protein n=1 Tax=Pendulispora rubella TaxID=2741070 RepID=A0ABZ2LB65_9BACT
MNTLQNLPILLRYEENGHVSAQCPLLPECECTAATRALALNTIQRLIKQALATPPALATPKGSKYEVVHLAVSAASDSAKRVQSRRPKPESPRIEVL